MSVTKDFYPAVQQCTVFELYFFGEDKSKVPPNNHHRYRPDVMGGWIKKAYEEKQVITFKLANESLYREMISYFVDDGHVCDYCKGLKGIKYLTDEPALTVMFRFDEEYVPGEG